MPLSGVGGPDDVVDELTVDVGNGEGRDGVDGVGSGVGVTVGAAALRGLAVDTTGVMSSRPVPTTSLKSVEKILCQARTLRFNIELDATTHMHAHEYSAYVMCVPRNETSKL